MAADRARQEAALQNPAKPRSTQVPVFSSLIASVRMAWSWFVHVCVCACACMHMRLCPGPAHLQAVQPLRQWRRQHLPLLPVPLLVLQVPPPLVLVLVLLLQAVQLALFRARQQLHWGHAPPAP